MNKLSFLELLRNSQDRIDANKGLALMGALVGAVILLISALQKYESLEWLFTAYLVATMGQLPSKGIHDLCRLKITKEDSERSNKG